MIDFFKKQGTRISTRKKLEEEFELCKQFIESSVQSFLKYPFKSSAMYTSPYRYTAEQGFAGWVCRIYTDSDYAFYDMEMDLITSDNIEYYVTHAVKTLEDNFNTGSIPGTKDE
jgi:hypothetical protein